MYCMPYFHVFSIVYMNKDPYIGKPGESSKKDKKFSIIDLQMPFLPVVDKNNLLIEVLISNKEIRSVQSWSW